MNAVVAESRLRRFLFVVVIGMCIGTIVELIFQEHYKEKTQLIPFVLCGLGMLSAAAVLFRPQRLTIQIVRGVMVLIIAGSLFGIWEHFETNYDNESEMRPNATITDLVLPTLRGAAPMLAPGMLAIAGVLGLAATIYHPVLGNRTDITN